MAMKAFIWERIDHATDNYHSEGGVVVFAKDEARARELANARPGCIIKANEMPDYVLSLTGKTDEKAIIMPDAGCC